MSFRKPQVMQNGDTFLVDSFPTTQKMLISNKQLLQKTQTALLMTVCGLFKKPKPIPTKPNFFFCCIKRLKTHKYYTYRYWPPCFHFCVTKKGKRTSQFNNATRIKKKDSPREMQLSTLLAVQFCQFLLFVGIGDIVSWMSKKSSDKGRIEGRLKKFNKKAFVDFLFSLLSADWNNVRDYTEHSGHKWSLEVWW